MHKSKERLFMLLLVFGQNAVRFAEQVQVRNTPHVVAVFVLELAFFVHINIGNVMFQNTADVAPTGTAADKVVFFIIRQRVGNNVLVHNQRVAGAGFERRDVRDTGDGGKHRTRRGGSGRKEMVKQNRAFG